MKRSHSWTILTTSFLLVIASQPAQAQITKQPVDVTVQAGGTATFSALYDYFGSSNVFVTWQRSTDGGRTFTDLSDGGGFSGATTQNLKITGVTTGMTGQMFRAHYLTKGMFGGPDTPDDTSAATLTVTEAPSTENPTDSSTPRLVLQNAGAAGLLAYDAYLKGLCSWQTAYCAIQAYRFALEAQRLADSGDLQGSLLYFRLTAIWADWATRFAWQDYLDHQTIENLAVCYFAYYAMVNALQVIARS